MKDLGELNFKFDHGTGKSSCKFENMNAIVWGALIQIAAEQIREALAEHETSCGCENCQRLRRLVDAIASATDDDMKVVRRASSSKPEILQ